MCKYCENTFDKIPVIDCDVDFGMLGKSKLSLYVEEHKNVTDLAIYMDNYGFGGRTFSQLHYLHFCPMCGRKLN